MIFRASNKSVSMRFGTLLCVRQVTSLLQQSVRLAERRIINSRLLECLHMYAYICMLQLLAVQPKSLMTTLSVCCYVSSVVHCTCGIQCPGYCNTGMISLLVGVICRLWLKQDMLAFRIPASGKAPGGCMKAMQPSCMDAMRLCCNLL